MRLLLYHITTLFACVVTPTVVKPWLLATGSLPRISGVYTRRHRGKGRSLPGISTAHDCPPGELILHLAWVFIPPDDRDNLCAAAPAMKAYARLRHFAESVPLESLIELQSMPPVDALSPDISAIRAYKMAAMLLLFDFDVGDLIRWLGGAYTHEHIPLDPIRRAVNATKDVPQAKGYPVQDFSRAMHILEHGAPVAASYSCSRADVAHRNSYDNHQGVSSHGPAVLKKIIADVNNQFILVFPRWIWRFIYGIFLSPIGFIERKEKGRIVVDPSNHVHRDHDTGALNDQLDKSDTMAVPKTYYASAQIRHWAHIWNLRISAPKIEILLYKDDINSAFHRCRYHPDIAVAYAYVWGRWLVIPIGLIFGGRNSPGWFCILSELRAFLATHSPYVATTPVHPLVDRITIPDPPTQATGTPYALAVADALNPGTGTSVSALTHHSTFVDDNMMAEYHDRIRLSIQRSTDSCYLMFGHPEPSLRIPSLSEEKFVQSAAHRMEQLGLDVDTRRMAVVYPPSKRSDLLAIIDVGWDRNAFHAQRQIAHLLGHTRTASTILPIGTYFSIRLQQWLNACLAKLVQSFDSGDHTARVKRAWQSARTFRTPSCVACDISLLRSFLVSPSADVIWSRPIGLLIPRTPHMRSLTDASYEGLGGYSVCFNYKWRLSSADLAAAGLPVLLAEPEKFKKLPAGLLHINVLEFLAIFINTWLAIQLLPKHSTPPGGWVLHFLADNTSALGWIHHASRSRRPVIQAISRAFAALLTFPSASTFTITSAHIPGVKNVGADALSRPTQFSTWSAAHTACPELAPLQAYRIPGRLLSHLRWLVSAPQIEGQLEPATLALLSLEPTTLSLGLRRRDSMTSHSPTRPLRTRGASSRRTRRR